MDRTSPTPGQIYKKRQKDRKTDGRADGRKENGEGGRLKGKRYGGDENGRRG